MTETERTATEGGAPQTLSRLCFLKISMVKMCRKNKNIHVYTYIYIYIYTHKQTNTASQKQAREPASQDVYKDLGGGESERELSEMLAQEAPGRPSTPGRPMMMTMIKTAIVIFVKLMMQ